jgi:hypothetical protein
MWVGVPSKSSSRFGTATATLYLQEEKKTMNNNIGKTVAKTIISKVNNMKDPFISGRIS